MSITIKKPSKIHIFVTFVIMIIFILILPLAFLFYVYFVTPMHYWEIKSVPYIKPWPIFGNMLPLVLRRRPYPSWLQDMYNEFPSSRYFGIYGFSKPQLVVRDVELVKKISIDDFDNFINRNSQLGDEIDPIFSKSLLSLNDQKWRDVRSALTPAFTRHKMRFLHEVINDCAENFVKCIETQYYNDVKGIDTIDVFSRFSNDAIATSMFGITTNSMKDKDNEFYLNGKMLTSISSFKTTLLMLYKSFPSIKKIMKVYLLPHKQTKYFQNIIESTIESRQKHNLERSDMIQVLLQVKNTKSLPDNYFHSKKTLTNSEITAQCILFYMAGFHTIPTALSFLCYELALNPNIQKRLQEELEEITENTTGKIPYDIFVRAKYLDMVVSESLRKWPPSSVLSRVSRNDYLIEAKLKGENNFILPSRSNVLIPVHAIHCDARYFSDPEKFDPERFSNSNKSNIVSGSYIPFGIGPRNCIAFRFALMEIKLLVFHLISKFEIVTTAKTQIPLVLGSKYYSTYAEKGIWLGFKRR